MAQDGGPPLVINGVHIYPDSYVPNADLSGLDLSGIDFSRVNFPNANFAGSNLQGANLSNANLPEANFSGANLKDAVLNTTYISRGSLKDANLAGADLSDTFLFEANLSNANFSNSILNGAILEGANLNGANLLNAKLEGVSSGGISGIPFNVPLGFKMINGAILGPKATVYEPHDFSGADLSGVDLTDTYLERCNFTGANLSGVNFTGAWVYRPDFTNADLTGAIFKDATCYSPTFENTTFTGADFSGAEVFAHRGSVSGTNFSETDLKGVNFSGASLFSANFSDSDLSGADMSNAKLGATFGHEGGRVGGGANFQGTNLSNTDLSGADLEDIISAGVEGVPLSLPDGFRLINGYILGPKVRVPSSADLSGVNLAGLNLEDISMPDVDLSGANLTGTVLAGAGIGWASPTPKDSELLPIIGEPASLPTHWELREGYLVDVTSPTLSLIWSQQLTHQFGTEYIDRGATAIDNEGFAIEVIVSGAVDGMIAGVYEIEYTATDDSGNISSIIRTITVADTIPPTVSLIGLSRVYHEAGLPYVDSGATAIDNVDGVLDVVVIGQVDFMTVGEYQIQYTATDNAGNVGSAVRFVTVKDNAAPEIQLLEDSSNVVEVGQLYVDPGVIAVDSVDEDLTVSVEVSGNVEIVNAGVYKTLVVEPFFLIYTASDQTGNKTTVRREINVTPDVTPPEMFLVGDYMNKVYLIHDSENDLWDFRKKIREWGLGVEVSDAVDSEIKIENSFTDPKLFWDVREKISNNTDKTFEIFYNDVTRPGVYALFYRATDQSNNSAMIYRVVQVRDQVGAFYTEDELVTTDFEAPVIALNGPEHVYLELGESYEEKGATAQDTEDGAVEISIIGHVNTGAIGTYAIQYYAEDRFGHASTSTRYVRVVSDAGMYAIDNLTFKKVSGGYSVKESHRYVRGNIEIPSYYKGERVVSIGAKAFRSRMNLTGVVIPDGVVSIGKEAFSHNYKNLTSVKIPESVKHIGEAAFMYCHRLSDVKLPSGIDTISKATFKGCQYRGEFTIPYGVKVIGESAFEGSKGFEPKRNGDIPNTVETIGKKAFSRLYYMWHNLNIPDSVKTIGEGAFSYNYHLFHITIGKNVTFIGNYAFDASTSSRLKTVTFLGDKPNYQPFFGYYSDPIIYVKADAAGFGDKWSSYRVIREGSNTTLRKGNTSDGPIYRAIVSFDANLNGLPDEGEPQATSNGWGDYWLDIPRETYDLNGNGVIDISEGVIVSQGGTDTATGLPMKTVLKGPASATVITPLTTLVTRVMEQNPELGASAAAGKLEASLGIPAGVDILSFDTFREASEENPSAADVLTATAKLQDTLVQGGNLIGGATGKTLQEGSDAVMDAIAQQVEAGNNVDLDSKDSLKSLITEAASTSGAILTEAQTEGAASIMEASSKAKEDARAAAGTVSELATEVSRVQAVSQSKAADDLEAVGAQTADLESTVLAYTGAAMQQQVQTEVVGDFNASSYEAPVFNFQSASYTVNENGQQQPVIQINRTGDSFETVELTVTPIASSATAGEDFNEEPVTVSFEPLEIRKILDLQTLLIDDALAEEAETFSLQLEVVRDPEDPDLPELPEGEEDLSPDRPSVGTLGLATLTIISDDIANEAPTVSSIEDLVISEGAAQVSVDFSVTDTDSSFDELIVQASTSNSFLISGLIVEGTAGEQDASQWTLNFATVADRFGEGTITVEINDGYQSVSTSFNVTVSAVNNAPQITGVPSVIEAEGRKVVIPFEVSDDQTSAGNLFIYLTAQPLDYILKGHVLVVGNGAQRELILNNSGNAEGTGQFSIVVTDAEGETASQEFEVNFGGEPPVAVVPELKLNSSDPSNLTLSWVGDAQLFFTEDLSSGFEAVAGATSPHVIKRGKQGFYILRIAP